MVKKKAVAKRKKKKPVRKERFNKTKPLVEEEAVETKSEKQKILDEYGGLESDVPLNSPYWNLK